MERLAMGTWVRLRPRRDCRVGSIAIMDTMFASPFLQVKTSYYERYGNHIYWRLSDDWLYDRDWFEVMETDPWNT